MHHKRGCGNYQKCKTACYTSVSYEAIADPFENPLSVSAKPEAGYKEGAEGNGKIVVKILRIAPIEFIDYFYNFHIPPIACNSLADVAFRPIFWISDIWIFSIWRICGISAERLKMRWMSVNKSPTIPTTTPKTITNPTILTKVAISSRSYFFRI